MTTLLAFVFVLGVLVFVHELGHFLAAKRVGIRVLKFQLGFNPTVISFRRGDTEYSIGALPLGGYVKMAGENPEDVERDERTATSSGGRTNSCRRRKWERFQVLIMGPIMNLAARRSLLTAVVLYQGVEKGVYEDQPPVVGVVTEGSPAARRRHPARRSDRCRWPGAPSTPGSSFLAMRSARAPNREIEIRPPAQRPRADAQGDADHRQAEPVRVRRHRRAAERPPVSALGARPASAARAGGPQGRRRRLSPSTASRSPSTTS